MFIILALIVLVAAFNIISTLIMVVMSKGKDIAILKSMGATSMGIMRIFIYEGLIIGLTEQLWRDWRSRTLQGALQISIYQAAK